MTTVDDLRGHIQQWDQGAWCLAALAITLATERDGAQARAARHVLDALNLRVGDAAVPSELRGQLAVQATA